MANGISIDTRCFIIVSTNRDDRFITVFHVIVYTVAWTTLKVDGEW